MQDHGTQILRTLGLNNWEYHQPMKGGGQAETHMLINRLTRQKGALKILKRLSKKHKQRFLREIAVLNDPAYHHSNIVRLIDYTKDENHFWYISPLGEDFKTNWRKKIQSCGTDGNNMLNEALTVDRKIASGLVTLHQQALPLVHRDIKPANLIYLNDEPVLIDFGLIFLPGEERLTDPDEKVGNRGFSHDTMMFRLDQVTPWLDVFQLSQLFIWMIAGYSDSHWDRPVDWRFVRYPNILKPFIPYILAFTGYCAEEAVAPSNAAEMIQLIDQLFYFPKQLKMSPDPFIRLVKEKFENTKKHLAIQKAERATRILHRAKLIDAYSASLQLHMSAFQQLFATLKKEWENEYFKIQVINLSKMEFSDWIRSLTAGESVEAREPLHYLTLRLIENTNLYIDITLSIQYSQGRLDKKKNPFSFYLRGGKDEATLYITDDARLSHHSTGSDKISLEQIKSYIQEWISGRDIWFEAMLG